MKKDTHLLLVSFLISFIVLVLIIIGDYLLISVTLLPDQGALWYYWKLNETNNFIRITYWIPYLINQILVWYFIFKLLQQPYHKDGKIGYYNKAIFITNVIFTFIHLIQTWLFYDGLAQDTPIMSSQGSVIVVLVLILILRNRTRGLFFGKTVKLFKKSNARILKYHGYFMAWAVLFTFWFHPMVNTPGHLVGFMYIFLLMTQLALPKTPLHSNKYWLFALEITVLIHGTTVALMNDSLIWTMFFTGFGAIFIITQIYGLGLSNRTIAFGSFLY